MSATFDFQINIAGRLPLVIQSTDQFMKHGRVHVQGSPKTELGRRILELRRKIEESGVPLLTLDEIRTEVRERRGERD